MSAVRADSERDLDVVVHDERHAVTAGEGRELLRLEQPLVLGDDLVAVLQHRDAGFQRLFDLAQQRFGIRQIRSNRIKAAHHRVKKRFGKD